MWRYALYGILLCTLLLPISAHVLVSDGKIGAVMHLDPEDDPIAGSVSTFHFWFKDKDNKLNTQNCTGFFAVIDKGTQLMTQPLFADNPGTDLVSNHQFTFPHVGIYTVRVWGTARNIASPAFQPFVLDYTVRVARTVSAQSPGQGEVLSDGGNWIEQHIVHIVVGVVLFGLALTWILLTGQRKKKAKK